MDPQKRALIIRTMQVEVPFALVFVGWFFYRALMQEMEMSDIFSFIVAMGVLFVAESFIR